MTRSIVHGTYTTYFWDDCRCDPCRRYQSQRVARSRAERLASGRLAHGKRSSYDAGCRCDPCRKTRREAAIRLGEYGPEAYRRWQLDAEVQR